MSTTNPLRRAAAAGVSLLCAATAVVTATAVATTASPRPAGAITWSPPLCKGFADCQAKGLGSAGYDQVYRTSHWGMYGGHNCTNYAAYRLIQRGIDASWLRGRGNAYQWGTEAAARGVAVDRTPAVGAIAWWNGATGFSASGHVAYVEQIDEASGTFLVSEDNYSADFDWRVYRIDEVAGFIHFDPDHGAGTFDDLRASVDAGRLSGD